MVLRPYYSSVSVLPCFHKGIREIGRTAHARPVAQGPKSDSRGRPTTLFTSLAAVQSPKYRAQLP